MTSASQALIVLPQASDVDIRPLVEAELARIREHPLFKDTTRMKRFLSYIVTESLEGRENLLKGYAIGLEVFDRPDDFDPQADTIVRVQAGQLRRRLDLYYAGDGRDSPVRILVPKGRYAPVFEVRREASLLASEEGLSSVVDIEKVIRPGIVVLTFQNLASDNDTEYFAEGVTAEVVNALVQFRYMRIVARTASVMESSTASSELSEIAKAYNVQFALTGNVRRAGNLMRVSVNLISVQTGEHVYSKIFDRQYTPENLFEVQEEIASHVAASVAAPFGAINRYNRRAPHGRLSSMKAYEALLKYYEMSISPTTSKAQSLLSEFEQITLDTPRFSSAWAVISLLNTALVTLQIPSSNPEIRLKTALSTARRAVEIDPENALAFNALFQANFHSGHFDLADEAAAKSIALNPNDYNMLAYYSIALASRGDIENARSFQSAALELVARPPLWFSTSALICKFQEKDFAGVVKLAGKIAPNSPVGVQVLGLSSMGHLSMTEKAQNFIKEALSEDTHYAKHVYQTMMYFHPNPELERLIHEGWRKAGLDIPV